MTRVFKEYRLMMLLGFPAIIGLTSLLFILPAICSWPSYSRSTIELDRFEQIWLMDNIYIANKYNENAMWAHNDRVYAVGSLNRCRLKTLSFKSTTGVVEKLPVSAGNQIVATQAFSVGHFEELIYLSYMGAFRDPKGSFGAAKIYAYNIKNGKWIWTTRIPEARTISRIYMDQNRLIAESSKRFALDPKAGSILSESSDITTPYAPQSIVLKDKFILVKGVQHPKSGYVEVVDRKSNDILWQADKDNVGYIGVNQTTVFYLTSESELIAADLETGDKVGSIQFIPNQVKVRTNRGVYVVANDNNQVFVYFGDSRQLFAFEFTPPEAGE